MKLSKWFVAGLAIIFAVLVFFPSCKKKEKKHDFTYDYQQDSAKTGDTINVSAANNPSGAKSTQKPNPFYSPQFVEITGYVRNGGGANVAFDAIGIGEIFPIQSIIIDDNGNFKLQTVIPEPGLYQLRFTNGMIHLFLRGGYVNLKTDISNLSGYQITGSPESVQLKDMYNLLNIYNDQIDNIQHRIDDLAKDKKRTRELVRLIDSQDIYYSKIAVNKSKDLTKFVSKLDTSAVALLASFYLEPYENYRFIKGILQKFSKICPHSKPYLQLDEKMKKVVPTAVGDYAPDMSIDNIFARSISLNSLRGKNVLVYFWTSSDQNCRILNPKLKSIYDNYRSKGFEVYAVSLDESKQEWQKAIDEDQLGWINVSNLLGVNDEISQNLYRVTRLPHTLLIDKQGKIVAKSLTPEALVNWLQKM
jgi:peroxiredoxin